MENEKVKQITVASLADELPFSTPRQLALLGNILTDKVKYHQVKDKIKVKWFNDKWAGDVFSLWVKWSELYDPNNEKFPTYEEIKDLEDFKKLDSGQQRTLNDAYQKAIAAMRTFDWDAIAIELTSWLRCRIYLENVSKSTELYNNKKYVEAFGLLEKSVKEYQSVRFFQNDVIDFSDWVKHFSESEKERMDGLTTGLTVLDNKIDPNCTKGCLLKGDTTILLASTGVGKCEAKGTEIIKFSGEIVKIEDIKPGDLLMGPDSKPRKVLSTTKGYGPLFKVTPNTGGNAFVCNDVHVLSLKCTFDMEPKERKRRRYSYSSGNGEKCIWKDEIVNIPLNEWQKKSASWKRRMKLWRAEIEYQTKDLPIDPYVLGIWLGDGHSHHASLTTMDREIKEEWVKWIESNGDLVRVYSRSNNKASIYAAGCRENEKQHKSSKLLKELNLLNNKHIPLIYLTSNRTQRLELLAGLIDTDGYYGGDNDPYFEITQKNKDLANNIIYLARSLGFKVNSKECKKSAQNGVEGVYVRTCIYGKLAQIPTRLNRKRGINSFKPSTTTKFQVESVGNGDYYGFTLDGDHLYLHSDFTVTHNTSTMITMTCANLRNNKDVLFVLHEGRATDVVDKFWCNITGNNKAELLSLYKTSPNRFIAANSLFRDHLTLMSIQDPALMTVEHVAREIERKQQEHIQKKGKGYDLLVIDYPAKLQSEISNKVQMAFRQLEHYVYNYFVQLALKHQFHALLAIQTNREASKNNRYQGAHGTQARLVSLEDVAESWGPITVATNVISINRNDTYGDKVIFHICKTRSSETGVSVLAKADYERCRTHSDAMGALWYKGNTSAAKVTNELLLQFKNNQLPSDILAKYEED